MADSEPKLPDILVEKPIAETVSATRPTAPLAAAAPLTLPRRFGNYELLEELGRGGMGVVYRARQISADRIVALKVIRRERLIALPRDTQSSAIDRFRHEAHAAARLEHDHLVTVFEVGEVEGEPFYSMRFVDGRSLSDILRDGPIEGRCAAGYMEPVARAMHDAHLHGILHRDLKPPNILVDEKSGRALVADFGLAKLVESSDELTHAGDVMGSPPYMPPEQARDASQVTVLSDVYSLGATLYHVLTGRPPFHAATPLETLRQVLDQEPVPPRQLNPSIHRDLETVCLKCLQKEPNRRYASAEAMADDLRRYLEGEPILARPISLPERAARWCRRNKAIASLVGATAAAVLIALAASVVGYVQTSAALEKAEARGRRLRGVVDELLTRVSEDTLLNQPGMQPLRQDLLEKALTHYRSFLDEFGDDPTLRDELAMANFRAGTISGQLGDPRQALDYLGRAHRLQQKLVAEAPSDPPRLDRLSDTLGATGRVLHRQHRDDEARAAMEESIAVRKRLVEAAPEEPEYRRLLANSHMNLGILEREAGRFEVALQQFATAQQLRGRILAERPGHLPTRRDVGRGHFERAVLALSQSNEARMTEMLGNDADAAEAFRAAAEAFETVLKDEPANLEDQYRLAVSYRLLGDVLGAPGNAQRDPAAAGRAYHQALTGIKNLADTNPDVPDYQAELAASHMNFGQLLREQEKLEEAAAQYEHAVAVLRRASTQCPDVPRYRRDLGVVLRELARVEWEQENVHRAREHLGAAMGVLQALARRYPENRGYQADLGLCESLWKTLTSAPPRP